MTDPHAVDPHAVYRLLSDEHRRHLLSRLLEAEYATVEGLSRTLAAREEGTAPRAVSEGAIDRVGISLVHDHLPRLADHGLCEFDARSGDVVTTDAFEELRPQLEGALDIDGIADREPQSELTVLYSEPPEDRFLVEDA
ncbi:hypothetical protein [Halovivax sp.]|uniref:DUF7344 domain-containing protein n=1 Tax=Halovivax sp. TaxID=1935978 RepID=UPI0025BFA3B7|nr:hypothetical protein [Halovivax sp.]